MLFKIKSKLTYSKLTYRLLLNQICICLPAKGKANLLTLYCGEEECSIFSKGINTRMGGLCSKTLKSSKSIRKAFYFYFFHRKLLYNFAKVGRAHSRQLAEWKKEASIFSLIFSLSLSLVLADLAVLKHVRIQEGIQVIRMGFIGALLKKRQRQSSY